MLQKAWVICWRSERDLNPRAHFGTPTPLAGEPLRPLGYHSESKEYSLVDQSILAHSILFVKIQLQNIPRLVLEK